MTTISLRSALQSLPENAAEAVVDLNFTTKRFILNTLTVTENLLIEQHAKRLEMTFFCIQNLIRIFYWS